MSSPNLFSSFSSFGSAATSDPLSTLQSMFKGPDSLPPTVSSHLTKVYSTLTVTMLAAVVGCFLNLHYHIGGQFSGLLCLLCVFAMSFINRNDTPKRFSLLMVFGVLQGMSLGPLVGMAARVDPMLVMSAFVITSVVFGCFTLSALMAKSRSYFQLGSILSSSLSFLLCLSVLSWFYPSVWLMTAQLYIGLIIFCGYVLYDTQIIMEKAKSGTFDFVGDAMTLFIDFVAIFVRILILLMRREEKKSKSNKNK